MTILLYIFGLYILLLALMIDMVYSIDNSTIVIMVDFLGTLRIFSTIYLDLFQDLSSLVRAFYFVFKINITILTGHFSSNFAPCFDLSMYDLLAIITCFILRVQMQKYFIILLLFLINISSYTLQKSDLNRFSGGRSIKTRLSKMRTCLKFCLLPVKVFSKISFP